MQASGRAYVVTGAGSGIGRAVVHELLGRGARVAGADVDAAGLAETARLAGAGERFATYVLDVSDREAVKAFAGEVVERLGGVDGLFNIAGVAQPFVRTEDVSDERIEAILAVNLLGPVWLVRAFLPHLRTRERAIILNTSSMAAIMPVPGSAVYAASKAALDRFGEGLAFDLRETPQITLTTVLPGTTWTALVAGTAAEMGVSDRLVRTVALKAETAARRIVDAALAGRHRVPVGVDAHLFEILSRISRRLAWRVAYLQVGGRLYRRAR